MDEFIGGFKFEEQGLSASVPVKYFVRSFESDNIVRLHYHNSLEINICRDIKGVVRLEGAVKDLSPDCLLVIPPDTPHSYRLKNCSGTIEVFHFLLDSIPGAVQAWHSSPSIFLPLSGLSNYILYHIEWFKTINTSDSMIILGHLLLFLGGLSTEDSGGYGRVLIKVPENTFLRRVIDFTEDNFQDKIFLDDVCRYAGVSKFHFCRVFKRETEETYTQYLKAVRLSKSLEYLTKRVSVSESAGACGFESPAYYIKCFKEEYGVTPLQWIKN